MQTSRKSLLALALLAGAFIAPFASAAIIITDTAIALGNPPTLVINGSGLNGGVVQVTLGTLPTLPVLTQSATQVTAQLPLNVSLQGTYLVTMQFTGPLPGGPRYGPPITGYDEAWITVGSTGPAGPPGPQGLPGLAGPPGVQGAKGDMGAKGDTGVKGDTGERGLTGAKGDVGVQGPPGPSTLTALTTRLVRDYDQPGNTVAQLDISCSAEFPNPLGGGCGGRDFSLDSLDIGIHQSLPIAGGWRCLLANTSLAIRAVQAMVVCGK